MDQSGWDFELNPRIEDLRNECSSLTGVGELNPY